MSQHDTNRNLLLAIMAVQMDFVPRDAMFSAMVAWTERKEVPLGQVLVERTELSPLRRKLLEQLVEEHIKAHAGDAARSLEAIGPRVGVTDDLEKLPDVEVRASLAVLRETNRLRPLADETISNGAPVISDATATFPVGRSAERTAGRFCPLRPHARGGLGVVSIALDSELDREVALKEIQEGHADNSSSRTRFILEAEVTGKLEHPAIIPIYGFGLNEHGRPYYAMRFIRGESLADAINRFHDPEGPFAGPSRHALQLRELLGRFLDVCDAMAYAHSRGVIHRDLKPANVMLGPFGETLVVDWGLALAIGEVPEGLASPFDALRPTMVDLESLPDERGAIIGTPAFMSPEQAEGDDNRIGIRSDVYGLGAILYELLTGRRPASGNSREEVFRAVREGKIVRPRMVRPGIPAGLEAICRKAMSLRAEERYADARSLASDLKSWLADEPVSAYPEPLIEKTRRWVRRNPALVGTVSAAILVGLLGLGGVLAVQARASRELDRKNGELTVKNTELNRAVAAQDLQRRRAEDREKQAIAAVKAFAEAIKKEPILNQDQFKALRTRLLREPQAFFRSLRDRLIADDDTRPEALASLGFAGFELARLTMEIGEQTDALAAYRETISIRERLTIEYPGVADYWRDLGACLDDFGLLLEDMGRPVDEALCQFDAAFAIQRKLVADHPEVPLYASDLAFNQTHRSQLFRRSGRFAEAAKASEEALAIRRRLTERHPSDEHRQELALSLYQVGCIQLESSRFDHANTLLVEAHSILQRLVEANPLAHEYRANLMSIDTGLAYSLLYAGKREDALKTLEDVLMSIRNLSAENSSVLNYQRQLAGAYYNRGNLLRECGRVDESIQAFESAAAIQRRLLAEEPSSLTNQQQSAATLQNLGGVQKQLGRIDAALASYRASLEIRKKLVQARPQAPTYQSELGATFNDIGTIELGQGRYPEARQTLIEAIRLQRQALASNPRDPSYRLFLKNHLLNLIEICNKLKDATGEAAARRELEAHFASDPALLDMDARIAAILKGDGTPRDQEERLRLAMRAYRTSLHAAAARFWGDALANDPRLAEDREAQHAYNAACSASIAGTGQGKDSPPSEQSKATLRRRAIGWLRGELAAWKKWLESGSDKRKSDALGVLRHWKADPDLAGVREENALAKLPEAERAEWVKLWEEVDGLLKRAN